MVPCIFGSSFPKPAMMGEQFLETTLADGVADIVDQLQIVREIVQAKHAHGRILLRHEKMPEIGE